MLDEIVAIYAIVEDLLKAIGHQEDCRIQMSDAEDVESVSIFSPMASPLFTIAGLV